ncbi:MAG: matrixin family metalloprotease [Alphaproteobacteria bacterium]
MGSSTVVSAFTDTGRSWPSGTITWAVGTTANFSSRTTFDNVLPANFVPIAQMAFDAWQAVADVTFQRVNDASSVDIRLGFVDSIDGPGGTGATTASAGFPTITRADIRFDDSETFVTGENGDAGSNYSFFHFALHEIGHALGLGHEDDTSAIMNTTIDQTLAGLTADDIAGIRSIYGAANGSGGGGADTDDQRVGDDSLDDTIDTGGGDDTLYGLGGDDTLAGGDGNDSIFGNRGLDSLTGGAGDDTLRGQFDIDLLFGGAGNDQLFGGAGNDTVSGGDGADIPGGNSGNDNVSGGAGNDTVRGQGGNDTLNGDDGNDTLVGHAGQDFLNGGAGADILIGGPGNDTLTGGSGVDVFVFAATQGADTVTDFDDGTDVINLIGASFADVDIVDTGGGALVTFEDTPTTAITLTGLNANMLSSADFAFT